MAGGEARTQSPMLVLGGLLPPPGTPVPPSALLPSALPELGGLPPTLREPSTCWPPCVPCYDALMLTAFRGCPVSVAGLGQTGLRHPGPPLPLPLTGPTAGPFLGSGSGPLESSLWALLSLGASPSCFLLQPRFRLTQLRFAPSDSSATGWKHTVTLRSYGGLLLDHRGAGSASGPREEAKVPACSPPARTSASGRMLGAPAPSASPQSGDGDGALVHAEG